MRVRRALAGVVCLGMAAIPALALAGNGSSRQDATYKLTSELPGFPTGEKFVFDYTNPDDSEAKPPAVEEVVTKLPRGARFDVSAPDSCTATDVELMADGADACPKKSVIGDGVVTVDSGLPQPGRFLTADVVFVNNAEDPVGEFVYIATIRDTPDARMIIRADVKRRKTITEAGMLPGTPPDGGAIDTVDLKIDPVVRRGRSYITTPSRCRNEHWTTRVRFFYLDDIAQTVKTKTSCIDLRPTLPIGNP